MLLARHPLSQETSRSSALLRAVSSILLAVFFLIVFTSFAWAETRTLRMYFTHTKESATITFKKNGRYVKSGLQKANRFLRDWRRKEPTRMDPELLDLVWEVYQASGSRRPIHVISGYRSPKTNNMLRRRGRKVAKTSQHTRGKALDFFMPDVPVKKLRALGLKMHRGGVGYYAGSFVHLDTGRVRHWPRMSRRQLVRVFPRGKTIHVPSDGRPLKGYKVAMANLKRGLNADGRKRKTNVKGSLLARIFSSSGSDGDEDEKVASRQPAKPVVKTAPPPTKPTPAKPVAVAVNSATKPAAKKTSGPDPFSLELTAAAKQTQRDAESEDNTQIASVLTVPSRRPTISPAATSVVQADSPEADPVAATELALATPPAALDALRPTVNVPAPTDRRLAVLRDETTTALAASRENTAAATAAAAIAVPTAEDLVTAQPSSLGAAPAVLGETRPSAPLEDQAVQVAVLPPEAAADRFAIQSPVLPSAAPTRETAQASQERHSTLVSVRPPLQDSVGAIAKPNYRRGLAKPTSDFERRSVEVPVPNAQPAIARPQAIATLAITTTGAESRGSDLVLGDLDGRAVKNWATAETTRFGDLAQLHAPNYRSCHKIPVPAAVFAVGFTTQRISLRADRFTGKALQKLALSEYQVSMR